MILLCGSLMMSDVEHLSICLGQLHACPLRRNVSSGPLPIFQPDVCGSFVVFPDVELREFFSDFGYIFGKYLLPFSRWPFCFVDGFLCDAKALEFDAVPLVYF